MHRLRHVSSSTPTSLSRARSARLPLTRPHHRVPSRGTAPSGSTDPLVVDALSTAWAAVTAAGGAGTTELSFDGYMHLSRKLYLALLAQEMIADFSPADFASSTSEDW